MEKIISRDSRLYLRWLIGRAAHLLREKRRQELAPYNITPGQANILFVLYNLDRKATLAELAKQTDRTINTLSVQMTSLERYGLVRKVRETPKSTLLRFELTEEGLSTYNVANQTVAYTRIMSFLSEEERQQIICKLKQIISSTKKYKIL